MIKKILVPLDGSALADRILVLARMLLVQDDTEVVLLRVTSPSPAEQAAALAHLKTRASELSLLGARVRTEVAVADDPAEGILQFASELGPSLVVTATHGDSSSSRWIRGSVAERILQRTEYPVLFANPLSLVPADPKPLELRSILVPLDGSDLGTRVLPLVKNVAKVCGSEVTLLHVVTRRARDTAAATVAEAEALLRAHEGKHLDAVKVRRQIAEGNAAGAILDEVERSAPDLVAITTHGRGGSSPWAFGSVAEQVLRHCKSPLLVYRTSGFAAPKARPVEATAKAEPRRKLILVPVDFSGHSRAALGRALDLARLEDCDVAVVHAIDRESLPSSAESVAEARRRVDALVAAADPERRRIKIVDVIEGRPWTVINHLATASEAHLLVVGKRPGADVGLGSVSERVVRGAPCDVLIVRGS